MIVGKGLLSHFKDDIYFTVDEYVIIVYSLKNNGVCSVI